MSMMIKTILQGFDDKQEDGQEEVGLTSRFCLQNPLDKSDLIMNKQSGL